MRLVAALFVALALTACPKAQPPVTGPEACPYDDMGTHSCPCPPEE